MGKELKPGNKIKLNQNYVASYGNSRRILMRCNCSPQHKTISTCNWSERATTRSQGLFTVQACKERELTHFTKTSLGNWKKHTRRSCSFGKQ
jgi:hypothetical protein